MRRLRELFNYHRLFLAIIFLFLFTFGFLSIIGVKLPSYDPDDYLIDEVTGFKLKGASPSWELPFGTDVKGYDIFSQFYYGLKTNIIFSLIAAIVFTVFGIFLGIRLGYYKKSSHDFERFLEQDSGENIKMISISTLRRFLIYRRGKYALRSSHLIKSFNSIPILLLVIFFAVILQNLQNFSWFKSMNIRLGLVMILFGLVSAPKLANMIIGKIKSLRAEEFIQSSIVLGIPDRLIIFKHILWLECRYIILYQFAYMMGQAAILEITLKYFNYGVALPWISWGTTLVNAFKGHLHLNLMFPILFITLTIYFYMGVAQEFKKYGEMREIQK